MGIADEFQAALYASGQTFERQMKNRTVVVRRSMSDLVSSIDSPDFMRCHRSYLVNLNYVQSIENCDFRLTDGTLVPIRAGSLNKMRDDFINWTYKKAWSRQ